jgi:hypothetical protein
VITKKPTEPYVQAGAEYGFNNDLAVDLMFGAPVGKAYYWFSGQYMRSDGVVPSKRLDTEAKRSWFDKVIRYDLYPVGDPFGEPPNNTFEDVTFPGKDQYIDDTGTWNHSAYQRFYQSSKLGYQITPDYEVGLAQDFHLFSGETSTYQPNAYNSYRGNAWKPKWPYFGDEQTDVNKFSLRNRSFEWPAVYRLGLFPYFRGRVKKFSIKINSFFIYGRSKQNGFASWDHAYVKGETYLLKQQDIYEPFHDEKTFISYGLWAFPSYEFAKWHRLNFSLQWRADTYLGHEQGVSRELSPEIFRIMGSRRYPVEDLRNHTLSLGVEDELKLFDRLKIAAGFSYDVQFFTTFKVRSNEEYGEAYVVEDDATLFGTRDSINPTVGLVYDPIKRRLRLRAAFAMKTRFPSLSEYAKITSVEDDEHLKPERLYNANAGFELFFMNKLISWRADYFINVVDDRIVKVAKDEPPQNMERTVSQGVETIFTAETGKLGVLSNLLGTASYTYLHARNKDDSENVAVNKGPYLEFTPEHFITADLRLDFVSHTMVSIWATIAVNQRIYVMDYRPTDTSDPYSTDYFTTVWLHNPVFLNTKISQRFLGDYEVYFMIRNILDDYNADPFDPGPGRMFYLGVTGKWH